MCLIWADKKQFGNKKYNHKFLNKALALLLLMAITEKNEIRSNLLQCPRDNNDKIFFTLMDYLNNLFMSNDPEDILRFYDYFDNRDQLIKWMMERPKGNYRIVEFNKENNDIIVVIPTMDVNGKFAKTCRDEIFKGLHIIFVESGIGNYYFNYAQNCNAGIKKAMEYNPKWIILSNDDMYKIDDVEVLVNELSKLDPEKIDFVFTSKIVDYIYFIIGKPRIYISILRRIIRHKEWKIKEKIFKKYEIYIYGAGFKNKFLSNLFYKNLFRFINTGSFGIFSGNFIKKIGNNLFDETYINGVEDVDLSLIINYNYKFTFINYKIGIYHGMSFGNISAGGGVPRGIREFANWAYFNKKFYNHSP